LDPSANLSRSGRPLNARRATVGDFWAWAFSDLRQNSIRGHLAEYIVAQALGIGLEVRSAFEDHDLNLPELLVPRSKGGRTAARIQVKAAGYLQGWKQKALSTITFAGLRQRPFALGREEAHTLAKHKLAKADVFVFAVQTAKLHEAYDAMDVDQWEFRVLPAHRIVQGSLGYPALCRMTEAVTFAGLSLAVRVAARERIQRLAGALAQVTKAKQRGDQAGVERWMKVVAELEA
jgi:hypothetical protein